MEAELNTTYDVIVLGTGFTESLVAAAAARVGKNVLHLDCNEYYGDVWTSFSLGALQSWVDNINNQSGVSESSAVAEEDEELLFFSDPKSVISGAHYEWCAESETAQHEGKDSNNVIDSQNVVTEPDEKLKENDPGLGNVHQTSEGVSSSNLNEEAVSVNSDVLVDIVQSQSLDEGSLSASSGEKDTDDVIDATQIKDVKDLRKEQWTRDKLEKSSRKFNIDLAPKALFSKGRLVELLISSNVSRYTEFKCLTRVLTWLNQDPDRGKGSGEGPCLSGKIVPVPCSRGEVFTSNAITLVEKRLLMKFLETCLKESEDQLLDCLGSESLFSDFVTSHKLTPKLSRFVTSSIAMAGAETPSLEGVRKVRLFFSSLGVYGPLPFLFPLYGSGEVPQAFCRLCAVFGGVYMLRQPVESLICSKNGPEDAPLVVKGVTSGKSRYLAPHVVISAGYAPDRIKAAQSLKKSISRAVYITDRSLYKGDGKEHCSILRIPKGDSWQSGAVTVLELPPGAAVCPQDIYLVHAVCEGSKASSEMKIVEERLFQMDPEEREDRGDAEKPKILFRFYFNQITQNWCSTQVGSCIPSNLYVCGGPDDLQDYEAAIDLAKKIFSEMFPTEEFLPRAPDPNEIVFDPPESTEPDSNSEPLEVSSDEKSATECDQNNLKSSSEEASQNAESCGDSTKSGTEALAEEA